MKNLSVGADPELFVRKNGEFISGHTFPCGTKEAPRKTKHGFVQVDGTALEVNVHPATSKREFVKNMARAIGDLVYIVEKTDKDCSLYAEPFVVFRQDYLHSLPIVAKRLGCNPDWNAYSLGPNPAPDESVPFRTGAGHVHVGFGEFPETLDHLKTCAALVKELDFYLGLPSLVWDSDTHRRELYGKAGAFRPKKYGFEYRVLSNAWVLDSKIVGYVFAQTKRMMVTTQDDDLFLASEYGDFAQKCINENRTDWASKAPKLAEYLLEGFDA